MIFKNYYRCLISVKLFSFDSILVLNTARGIASNFPLNQSSNLLINQTMVSNCKKCIYQVFSVENL